MERVHMPDAPDRYEQVARMKYIEGRTWGQIAHALDIPKSSMERLKKRIRQDMETALHIMHMMRHKAPPTEAVLKKNNHT